MSEKAKLIEVFTFMAVLASGAFTVVNWLDTERELSETNIALNNARISLSGTELLLKQIQTRLSEIQIEVGEISTKNFKLENTLLGIEIATRPKRDKVALAKEVREAALMLSPRTNFVSTEIIVNANQGFIKWEINNHGQGQVEVVLLELNIAEETPLLFNTMTRYRGARLYELIAGIPPSVSSTRSKAAPFFRAIDQNLVPTAAFAYPSLIDREEIMPFSVRFVIDKPKNGVLYHYRAIFGVRAAPSEFDYYLDVLKSDKSTEARLYQVSRKLLFSSGSFSFNGIGDDFSTIDKFILENGLDSGPNPVEIEYAQHYLNELGYRAGKVDGKSGPNTKVAIKQFQTKYGLPTNGELDIRTLTLVRNEMSKISQVEKSTNVK